MTTSKVTIVSLTVTLAGSNAWWLYRALDVGVTLTHQEVSLRENREALAQALAILPLVVHPGADRAQVLKAAADAAHQSDSFEKEGYVWVGALGLKFDDDGHLVDGRSVMAVDQALPAVCLARTASSTLRWSSAMSRYKATSSRSNLSGPQVRAGYPLTNLTTL